MEKTPITQAIEKLQEFKKELDLDSNCDSNYDSALNDAIVVLTELLPKEKEVIEKAFEDGFCDGIQVPQKINRTAYGYFEQNYTQTPLTSNQRKRDK